MSTDSNNRVTSLSFLHYKPEEYLLPRDSNLSLNVLNKTLLGLFNNDVYMYTNLVGKVKGLWWKYWFKDDTVKGYSTGDMVCVNGIEEIRFLKQHWNGIRQIVDHANVVGTMPDFQITNENVVSRYMSGLTDNFNLGNRSYERQVYISLVDDNKERVSMEDVWRPYLVTREELHKRENFLVELLEDALSKHDSEWHPVLDEIDHADRQYELFGAKDSIYNDLLTSYIPTEKSEGKESQAWIDFLSTEYGNQALGFGQVNYDFLHIFKPLGTDVHHLETWVRTDGHVTVKGFVPTGLMTEIIPQVGTQEYNRWKMGGQRRFAFRFDYPLNDSFSKLFFRDGRNLIDTDDEKLILGNAKDDKGVTQVIYKRDDSKDAEYQSKYAAVEQEMNDMDELIEEMQAGISQTKVEQLVPKAEFPASTDAWCKAEDMIYPEGVISPALVEFKYIKTGYRPFFFNPRALELKGERTWLINPKYKRDSTVIGLINPKELLGKINKGKPDSSPEWKYWKVVFDTTINSPEIINNATGAHRNVYSRHVVLQLADRSIEMFSSLLSWSNENVRNLVSSKNGQLKDWLDNDAIEKKFRITRIEIDQKEEELTQTFLDQDTGKTVSGKVHVTYDYITQIEAAIDLIEDTSDHLRVDDVVEDLGDLADDMIRDALEDSATRVYTLISYKKGVNAIILYYPKNNGDTRFEDILESDAREVIRENGHMDIFKDLLENGYEHTSNSVAVGSSIVESHAFLMKTIEPPIDPGSRIPIDTTDESDPAIVSSNMRLIREFGITSSPPILHMTSAVVLPDAGQLMTPSLNCCPGATLSNWTWEDGQSVIFNVPNGTQNISFELTGMLDNDNVDYSFYCITPETWSADSDTTGRYRDLPAETIPLKWVWKALQYKAACAKLRIGEAEGLSSSGAILHMNAQHMIDGITSSLVDNLSFTSLMRARVLDWGDETKPGTIYGLLDEVKREGDMLTGYKELDDMYALLYKHIETYMRLGYLYFIYENMLAGLMTANKERVLMLHRLRSYLLNNDKIDASEVQQRLSQGNEMVMSLTSGGKLQYAKEMSSVMMQINKYHEKHMRNTTSVRGELPALPSEDSDEYAEYREAATKWHDAMNANVNEIRTYCDETLETISSIEKTKALLKTYLGMDLEASLNNYVRTSIAKLDFSAMTYFLNNYYIAKGYMSYLDKWCGVLQEAVPATLEDLRALANKLNYLREGGYAEI